MSKKNGGPKPPVAKETIRTPDGVIRKGDRRLYKKGSNEVIERRIEQLVAYYQKHPFATRFDVHKRFCKQWGIDWPMVDQVYILRAKKLMAKRAAFTVEEAREKTLGVVMRHMDSNDPKVALAAAKLFAEVTGAEAPKKQEWTGPNGGPIQIQAARPLVDVSVERLRQLALMKPRKEEK